MKKLTFIVILFAAPSLLAQSRFIDSLKQVVSSRLYDTLSIDALNKLAVEYGHRDIAKMQECLYQAVSIAKRFNTSYGLSNTYAQFVTMYQNTSKTDSALRYLQKLEQLANHSDEVKVKTNYYGTAGLFYRYTGNYKKSLIFMHKSLELLRGEKAEVSTAGQLLNIGNTYLFLGEMREAARYHLEALQLFEKLNNKRGQSFCLQNLGNDFLQLNDYEMALKYFTQALKVKEELKDQRGLITAWGGIGQVYRELKNYKEARYYLEKAHEQVSDLKITSELANVLLQLGLLEKGLGDTKKARALLNESLQQAKLLNDEMSIVKVEAELKALDKEAKRAELGNVLEKKVTASSVSGDRQSEAEAHANLADYYASEKKYDKAYQHLQRFVAIHDSVQGSAVVIQLRELEKKYETQRKENEIALLKKDQGLKAAVIDKQNANLILVIIALISVVVIGGLLINRYRVVNSTKRYVEMEKMRNTIARDLHDDIGSTLSSINILSRLALESNGNSAQYLIRIAENASRMMENMSDMVWSINPGNDSPETLTARMNEFSAEILEPQNIAYTITGEEVLYSLNINVEKRKNLFLIFKEAINNAAKYSDASEVQATFSRAKNVMRLHISDNGKGFDLSAVQSGNGLKNMTARAEAVGGKLTVNSIAHTGTTVTLQLPIT